MEGKGPKIAVVGSLIFDFVAKGDRLPRRGETVLGSYFGTFTGGKGANQAVQAARLGARTTMIGRVGSDFLGDRMLEALQGDGIDTRYIRRDADAPTGACCIHIDQTGSNAIVVVGNANANCTEEDADGAREAIAGADAVLVQLETNGRTARRTLELARESGVLSVFNPAPPVDFDLKHFALADWVTPNETEAEYFTGVSRGDLPLDQWLAKVGERFFEAGVRRLVVTLGAEGCWYADAEGESALYPALPVEPVDTTAAGDAFNAALALALAEGRSRDDAIRFANGAGALCASRAGSQASLARRAELEAYLASLASH